MNRAKISVKLQESLCAGSFPWTLRSTLSSLALPMTEDDDDAGLRALKQAKIAPSALPKQ